jgi:signal peptidase
MNKKSKIYKVIDQMVSFLLIAIVIISSASALFFTYYRSQNKMVNLFGYSVCYVITGSMEPVLEVGDVLLIKDIEDKDLRVDDIITYKSTYGSLAGNYITHRIVSISENDGLYLFRTKGDANPVQDAEIITIDKIEGVYQHKVAIIKVIMAMLSNWIVFISVIILPLSISLGLQLVNAISSSREEDETDEEN